MSITITDISNEELILSGGSCRAATLEEPEEFAEVFTTPGKALGCKVYMIANAHAVVYVTADDDQEENPVIEIEAMLAGTATNEQVSTIQDWMEQFKATSESDMWKNLTDHAQEKYSEEY